MSAFIVGNPHIAYIVRAAAQFACEGRGSSFGWVKDGKYELLDGYDQEKLRLLGQILLDANVKSVNTRYQEDAAETYEHRPVYDAAPVSLVGLFKAIHCLDYNSCEFDGWEASEAYAILDSLKNHAIRALPGYDKAAWEVRA